MLIFLKIILYIGIIYCVRHLYAYFYNTISTYRYLKGLEMLYKILEYLRSGAWKKLDRNESKLVGIKPDFKVTLKVSDDECFWVSNSYIGTIDDFDYLIKNRVYKLKKVLQDEDVELMARDYLTKRLEAMYELLEQG